MIKSLEWRDGKVRFLDQTKLPQAEEYIETDDEAVVAQAIKRLAIRGAPLIGIAAAYGVVLAANKIAETNPAKVRAHLDKTINTLVATRPTAVNLFWALGRQRRVIDRAKDRSLPTLRRELLNEAAAIHREDEEMCQKIGLFGADILPNAATVLTHCNTGALATGGKGTALGIIQTAWEQRKLKHVYIGETRPLLQGSRLTAWELKRMGIPSTLVTDTTTAFLMKQGLVNAVVVGADRIARNGDVANKVGTYGLAVLAKYHSIPLYVAAPSSTIDFDTIGGKDIPIEQRRPEEVTEILGKRIAPEGVEVYSPAFDVTPGELVTAIVTDCGVLFPPFKESIESIKHQAESVKSEQLTK